MSFFNLPTSTPYCRPVSVDPLSSASNTPKSTRVPHHSTPTQSGRFTKQTNKLNTQQSNRQLSPGEAGYSPSAETAPQNPSSPTFSPPPASAMAAEPLNPTDNRSPSPSRKPPFYFREENSSLIVKGNFMTLAAKPEHVELGEWLAHQVVEQYRLLEGMIKIIQEVDSRTGVPVCNPSCCPYMTAGSNTIYTWLDSEKRPIRVTATYYITLVQKWILGKINDPKIFPTDTATSTSSSAYPSAQPNAANNTSTPIPAGPTNLNAPLSALAGREWVGKTSGFPESFESDIKNLYRQMFRCYAHLYYAHWLDPFYHLGVYKELNTCFIHFVNVGKQFDLLADRDLAPMQPLVEIWLSKGLLPSPQAQAAVAAAAPEIASAPA